MLLYYITDQRQFPGNERQQRESLLAKISEAARCGVDYIQLREKDLSARELLALAKEAVGTLRAATPSDCRLPEMNLTLRQTEAKGWGTPSIEDFKRSTQLRGTRLLVNSRVDVALAAGADGVHLTSSDISARDARMAWSVAAAHNSTLATPAPVIGVSCHKDGDVRLAEGRGADFAVFAPVFEKTAANLAGVGLEALRRACESVAIPVFALGGVSLENAAGCMNAGAAGIAGIRLFQNNDVARVVAALRGFAPSRP